jgi:hypothetical protein
MLLVSLFITQLLDRINIFNRKSVLAWPATTDFLTILPTDQNVITRYKFDDG